MICSESTPRWPRCDSVQEGSPCLRRGQSMYMDDRRVSASSSPLVVASQQHSKHHLATSRTILDSVVLQYDLDNCQAIMLRFSIRESTLAFTTAASACVLSPSCARRYPGFVGSTSGSTPTELMGQLTPIRADMSAATSACSTSLRSRCDKPNGAEYASCDDGVLSGRGPRTPLPHAISGVRVLSGSAGRQSGA